MIHQRFSVAVFMFLSSQFVVHTSEIKWETEVEALKQFKLSITNDPSGSLTEWTNAIHHCNWSGITCDSSDHVINISLFQRNLHGSISPFIGNLTYLEFLDHDSNSFFGNIPSQLQQCSNLTQLNLYDNSFSGEIPGELGNLKNLNFLDLGNNFFDGSIPDSICNCTSLEHVAVVDNNLTGVLPSGLEFAYMKTVTTKVDVFSFGVLIMELITKRRPTGLTDEEGAPITLSQLVQKSLENGINSLQQVLDPQLAPDIFKKQEAIEGLLALALSCTNTNPKDRPDMEEVLGSITKLKMISSRSERDSETRPMISRR